MYRAPVKDVRFVLRELVDESALQECSAYADYSPDLADAVLEEAGKFAENVLDPLYKTGDREGAKWTPEGVVTPAGFKAAYQQYVEGGWPSLRASAHYGGQGAPILLGTAVEEFWGGANLGFKLCPMLTQGAIEALEFKGTDAQKDLFLPKMVSGEWTGTMNLTEPQAGSDLAAVRTRAAPDGANYRLFGQKIFITYGEHDFAKNVIHMVLARIDGAPPGVKGISLFIVPKFIPGADGEPGARNDVQCISIEHKLGIHASPTCVMAFGQKDGALGYLVGEPNRGLEYMFVMMNAARLSVGLEGYAVAERAFQQAAAAAIGSQCGDANACHHVFASRRGHEQGRFRVPHEIGQFGPGIEAAAKLRCCDLLGPLIRAEPYTTILTADDDGDVPSVGCSVIAPLLLELRQDRVLAPAEVDDGVVALRHDNELVLDPKISTRPVIPHVEDPADVLVVVLHVIHVLRQVSMDTVDERVLGAAAHRGVFLAGTLGCWLSRSSTSLA